MRPVFASLSVGDWAAVVAATTAVATLAGAAIGIVWRWLRYRRLLIEAVYEAAHNLHHIADRYDSSRYRFVSWPEFYVPRATELLQSPSLSWTIRHAELFGDIDHMLRNDEYIRRFPFDVDGLLAAQNYIEYFVEHAVRFLLHAAKFRGARRLMSELRLDWLVELSSPHVRFGLRDAQEDRRIGRHDARADSQLVCWVGSSDKAIPNLGDQFKNEMRDPPPDGVRPPLPKF